TRRIVLGSPPKVFPIAGLRLGYLVAGRDVAQRLRESCEPWSVNVVAERVANACLEVAGDFVARSRALIAAERVHLSSALASVEGVHVFASSANFLMLEIVEDGRRGGFPQHMLSCGLAA